MSRKSPTQPDQPAATADESALTNAQLVCILQEISCAADILETVASYVARHGDVGDESVYQIHAIAFMAGTIGAMAERGHSSCRGSMEDWLFGPGFNALCASSKGGAA